MGKQTGIQWTDATWNPWIGCQRVSPGCDHCYMFSEMKRYGRNPEHARRTNAATFNAPLHWKEPRLVFTCSWSDFFIAEADEWRPEAWDIMRRTPHLTYQVLTKRPTRMRDWFRKHGWLPNVWAGVSVESQDQAHRLDVLAEIDAPVRFASCEPLLGPVDMSKWLYRFPGGINAADGEYDEAWGPDLHWVIVGGESGPKARPFDLEWPKQIVDQCDAAGVPVFVKQLGAFPCIPMRLGPSLGDIFDDWFETFSTNGGRIQYWEPTNDGDWARLHSWENRMPVVGSMKRAYLRDRKGGDWDEWPEDLRVREMPATAVDR